MANKFTALTATERASAPTTPDTADWRVYFKSDGLYVIDDAGVETGPLGSAGATDHGALTGLGDDDHTQYALINATRDFTGTVGATAFDPAGLTGATAASRYVGATASGAPASGTFAVGDFIIDQSGSIYVCTSAGSPGTWTEIGGGGGGGTAVVAETVLGTAASSITFSSIPGTYRHLMLVMNARLTVAFNTDAPRLRINGDTGSNYDEQNLRGNDTTASATATAGRNDIILGQVPAGNATAGRSGAIRVFIPNYAGTTFQKPVFGDSFGVATTATSTFYRESVGGLWRNTAAITSLEVRANSGNLDAGTVATLYGLNTA